MNTIHSRSILFLALTALVFSPFAGIAQGQDKVDFVKQIKPIFEKHCMECHGPVDENDFRIDVKEDAEHLLGEADDSELYAVITSDDEDSVMPPIDFEYQMTSDQKALIKKWLDEGADWPEDVEFVQFVDEGATTTPPSGEGDQASSGDQAASGDGEGSDEEKAPAAEVDPKIENLYKAAGSLHPAMVHLPIGLLLASGFFALFSLRGNFVMSDCAYYCLWLGTLGAILASVSGWFWSPMESKGTVETFSDIFDTGHQVYWHRLGALITTIFGLVLALFAASARSRDPDEGVMWKLGAIILACGVGWVGHTGGELHYGHKHYKHLEAVWQDWTGGEEIEGDAKVNGEAAPVDDDTSLVGKSSEEEGDN